MNKTLVSTAVLTVALVSTVASGDTLGFLQKTEAGRVYLGLQLSNSDLESVPDLGQDMNVLNATIGYYLRGGLSIEARMGAGSDQFNSVFQDPVSTYAAGLLRYHYTWTSKIMVYASVGGGVRTHSDALELREDRQGGLAVAFGVNLFGNDRSAVNIEYFTMTGDQRYSSIGIGYHHYFGKY